MTVAADKGPPIDPFDEWFHGVEGYGLRSERAHDDIKPGDGAALEKWLREAWEQGRQALSTRFVAAAHHQGGHSRTGEIIADALGVPFPLRMENLHQQATREGYDAALAWPWYRPASSDTAGGTE